MYTLVWRKWWQWMKCVLINAILKCRSTFSVFLLYWMNGQTLNKVKVNHQVTRNMNVFHVQTNGRVDGEIQTFPCYLALRTLFLYSWLCSLRSFLRHTTRLSPDFNLICLLYIWFRSEPHFSLFTCGTGAGRASAKPPRPQRMLTNWTHLLYLPSVYHANQKLVHVESEQMSIFK